MQKSVFLRTLQSGQVTAASCGAPDVLLSTATGPRISRGRFLGGFPATESALTNSHVAGGFYVARDGTRWADIGGRKRRFLASAP